MVCKAPSHEPDDLTNLAFAARAETDGRLNNDRAPKYHLLYCTVS
jgi:hypothetical protein